MKHIAVEIAGDIAEDTELVPLRLSLNQIYKACEPLESFHIHYPHGDHASDFDMYDFFKPFTDRGHNLQSLSYHVEQWNWGRLNHDAIDVLYRVSQESFRQVQQLAVYFEEALMLDGLWNEEARFMILMVSGSYCIQSGTSFKETTKHARVCVDVRSLSSHVCVVLQAADPLSSSLCEVVADLEHDI